jgi:hypothetical protein
MVWNNRKWSRFLLSHVNMSIATEPFLPLKPPSFFLLHPWPCRGQTSGLPQLGHPWPLVRQPPTMICIPARFRRIHAGDRGHSLPSPGLPASLSLFRVEPEAARGAGVARRKMQFRDGVARAWRRRHISEVRRTPATRPASSASPSPPKRAASRAGSATDTARHTRLS